MDQVKMTVPRAVQAAFEHVKSKYPDVTQVTFDKDLRWLYSDCNGKTPAFTEDVDVGTLEDAADALTEYPITFAVSEGGELEVKRDLPDLSGAPLPTLVPSGRFITDCHGRKVAEMFQPGDSPAEQEAIKHRIVGSFNALPSLVGVLLRADKQGALWYALYNQGITDAYEDALREAIKALGDDGIVATAQRYEIDPDELRAKAVVE